MHTYEYIDWHCDRATYVGNQSDNSPAIMSDHLVVDFHQSEMWLS